MLKDKRFYKELPAINGYKWGGFSDELHIFIKQIPVGFYAKYVTCLLSEDDINDTEQFEFMLNNNRTRV